MSNKNIKNPLAFEEEPLSDRDFTLQEALEEARRCLNCANPMCRKGCPIHNEIPQFIHELSKGNFGAAAEHIYNNSDLPAICGRVCPRENQCEGSCILGKKGKHIEIGKLERFVADTVIDGGMMVTAPSKKTNGKVAIVGSGPAGLTVASQLLQKDYDVTIFEAKSQPGGMLLFGIPSFRLHKEYIYREVERLKEMGAEFLYNTKIGHDKQLEELFQEGYEAVFLGIGASVAWKLGVDNDAIHGVVDATKFLQQVEKVQLGEERLANVPIKEGDQVVVIGAGNVAIDAARTAVRLKANVSIVYRRAERNMKCLPSEYEEAKADGVKFQFYSAPVAVVGTDHVEGLKYEKQEILEDATMVPTGEFGIVPANKIIAAVGNRPEKASVKAMKGVEKANRDYYIGVEEGRPYGMTTRAGVFAAGDIVHKPATVVLAMREGKKTAVGIDQYVTALHILKGADKGE